MDFAKRAVNAFTKAMSVSMIDESLIQDILKCKRVDVTSIEPFLASPSYNVRQAAARVIGEKGNLDVLLKAAFKEEEPFVLNEMMKWLGKRKAEGLEILEGLLRSDDTLVREAAIHMFRKAKPDQLFPMLFDEDDNTVQRIKRYFDEQERQNRQASCT